MRLLNLPSESGSTITEADMIRCNSSGLTIYNPKTASEHLKAMKNKNITREAENISEAKIRATTSLKLVTYWRCCIIATLSSLFFLTIVISHKII